MMIREGASISYSGLPSRGIAVGDEGKVIALDREHGVYHVLWHTGSRAHEIDGVYSEDVNLIHQGMADELSESLSVEDPSLFALGAAEYGNVNDDLADSFE